MRYDAPRQTTFHPSIHTAARDDKVSKRILIMMSNTGGGHKASAEAIKAGFQEKYGDDYEVRGGAQPPSSPCRATSLQLNSNAETDPVDDVHHRVWG